MPPPPQDENLAAVVSSAAQDIGSFIRSQREAAQVSVRQLAEKAGVSNPYLSQIERGLRKPSADVLNQIAKALRVSAEVLYIQAGILEPTEASEVRDAIVTDTAITERQKQVLLDIYTSFCAQNEAALAEANLAQDVPGASVSDADEEPATENHKSPLQISRTPQSIAELNPEKEGNNHG
ncbi:transcriptional regulator with XRE-family HTH domain [Mycolicibacterium iranicum]|uniref:Transcriptional regulator with XRE-family HTH domain n=1 Tax=Mycolicibacterium iranicum TaxID=912594 RepID=A0A839Q871_MYCIR|nr:helix-turn-helix transcriptional regulator [Mycolicibacterium iranicum]MBB2989422.1 transcriptional regulator with XRE-family HTH domain [Mycolicibacterium iranicum]